MIKSSTLNFVRDKAKEAQAFVELEKTLTEVASQAQHIKKAEETLADLRKQQQVEAAALQNARDERKRFLDETSKTRASFTAQKTDVEKLVIDAEDKARRLIDDAQAEAHRLAAVAQKQLEGTNANIRALEGHLVALQHSVNERVKEYEDLGRKHDALALKHKSLSDALRAVQGTL